MIDRYRLANLKKQGLLASVRVVPVPFKQTWCIDAVVRTPLEAGSTTDTVAKSQEGKERRKLREFNSIDSAASYLRDAGVQSFTVDTADSVSFANVDGKAGQVLETTLQIWDNADEAENDSATTAA